VLLLRKIKIFFKKIYLKFMGIGDWGLGIGDWGLGPIPNPHLEVPINIHIIKI